MWKQKQMHVWVYVGCKKTDKQSDAENTHVEDDTETELETRAVCDWHVYYTTRIECRRRCRFTYGHLYWYLPEASYSALLVCWSRIGQMARRSTPERSRARVYSDSSQRCRMRRRRRQDRRENRELKNIQEWYGAWVGWFLERHTESLKHPEPMHVHWMKCAKCDAQREKCAHACARWGVICTPPVAFTTCANAWTRNLSKNQENYKADECARLQRNLRTQGNLGNSWNNVRRAISFLMLVCTWIICGLRLPFLPPLLVLPSFWLPHSPLLRIF